MFLGVKSHSIICVFLFSSRIVGLKYYDRNNFYLFLQNSKLNIRLRIWIEYEFDLY